MLYNLLQPIALMAQGGDFGDLAATAGIVSLQGMLTIFLVLSILWGAIEIMHRLLHGAQKKTSAPEQSNPVAAVPNQNDAAVAAAIAAALAASEDDGATVAAITAAITTARNESGENAPFRVVSFKRSARSNRRS